MTEYKTIEDLGDLNGKVAMLRADLNVHMDENFNVTNTARIDRTVPTIKLLMNKGAKVVVISHFGRPEGKGDMKNSLSHIVKDLEKSFTSELKAEISKGLEIKVDKTLSSGFRIGVKNGAAFYDYSAESLAQMFSAYLNPKVAGLIQIAAKDAN